MDGRDDLLYQRAQLVLAQRDLAEACERLVLARVARKGLLNLRGGSHWRRCGLVVALSHVSVVELSGKVSQVVGGKDRGITALPPRCRYTYLSVAARLS